MGLSDCVLMIRFKLNIFDKSTSFLNNQRGQTKEWNKFNFINLKVVLDMCLMRKNIHLRLPNLRNRKTYILEYHQRSFKTLVKLYLIPRKPFPNCYINSIWVTSIFRILQQAQDSVLNANIQSHTWMSKVSRWYR